MYEGTIEKTKIFQIVVCQSRYKTSTGQVWIKTMLVQNIMQPTGPFFIDILSSILLSDQQF